MDGRPDACAHCGVPLVAAGRFCSNCGAPVAPVTLRPTPPAPPAGGGAVSAPAGDPYESLYAEPPPAPVPPPVVEPAPPPETHVAAYAAPAPVAEPLAAEPAPPRGTPGPGLWIGAVVLLVGVLVLGSYLLVHGSHGGGSPAASSSTPYIPKPHHTSPAASSAPASSAPPSAPPTGRAVEVAGLAQASAPRHAPAAVDFANQPVTYVASNMVDGRPDTCWRAVGDATGTVLTFRLAQPTTLTRVGLINGYDKVAFSGGHAYDWYAGNRRVLSVDWIFDDGTTVSQPLAFSRTMQTVAIAPVKTQTVRLRITSVSPPGQGRAGRDDTAVSEVSLRGSTG